MSNTDSESRTVPIPRMGYRMWRCGQCNGTFATRRGVEETEQCPYCGAVTLAATEDFYKVVKEE